MHKPGYAGALAGRTAVREVLVARRLKLAAYRWPRCIGLLAIDHVAAREATQIVEPTCLVAEGRSGDRLSDRSDDRTGPHLNARTCRGVRG